MSAIKELSSVQIDQRLAELETATGLFEARDMDAELAEILRDGGDVDALENQQLESEKAARRLRAERQALVAARPDALKREGAAQLDGIVAEHKALAAKADKTSLAMRKAWDSFAALLEDWTGHQETAEALTRQAGAICKATGADTPELGRFLSARLADIGPAAGAVYNQQRLVSSQDKMVTQSGPQGVWLDQ